LERTQHLKRDIVGFQEWQCWSTQFYRPPAVTSTEELGNDVVDTGIPQSNSAAGIDYHWKCFGTVSYIDGHSCNDCSHRLTCYLLNNPDQLATIFVDSTQMSYVEISFLDPDDGVSQWRYRFFHSGPPKCIEA
jgi:hypothetical protein